MSENANILQLERDLAWAEWKYGNWSPVTVTIRSQLAEAKRRLEPKAEQVPLSIADSG